MRDIILLAAVVVATLIGFRRPYFGLATFSFLGFFSPQSFTWGFARTFPFSLVVAVGTILGMVAFPERKRLQFERETWMLFLLWAIFGLSTIWALYPVDALERFIHVSKVLLMIIVATVLVNDEDRLQWLIRIIGYSLGFYALKGGVFAIITGGTQLVYGPDISFLAANNSIGMALAMNIPILAYLIKAERIPSVRWTARLMFLLSYPAVICTYSRGAWLGLLIGTALIVVKSRRIVLVAGIVGVLVVLLQAVVPMIAPDPLVRRYDDLINYENEASAQSRLWNWEFCKRVGLARPLTGGGFNFYRLETYTRFYPEFAAQFPGKVWSCHSTWLTIFGEHGFPGAIVWLSLIGLCMSSLRQIRAHAKMDSKYFKLKDFANMVQGSMAIYFVSGTFIDMAYFDLFYYLLAFVIIQKQLLARITTSSLPKAAGFVIKNPNQLEAAG